MSGALFGMSARAGADGGLVLGDEHTDHVDSPFRYGVLQRQDGAPATPLPGRTAGFRAQRAASKGAAEQRRALAHADEPGAQGRCPRRRPGHRTGW